MPFLTYFNGANILMQSLSHVHTFVLENIRLLFVQLIDRDDNALI